MAKLKTAIASLDEKQILFGAFAAIVTFPAFVVAIAMFMSPI